MYEQESIDSPEHRNAGRGEVRSVGVRECEELLGLATFGEGESMDRLRIAIVAEYENVDEFGGG